MIDGPMSHDGRSTGMDGKDDGHSADLDEAVEAFVRDARAVYEEYDEGYLDPDAALFTLEGHIDALEDAFDE